MDYNEQSGNVWTEGKGSGIVMRSGNICWWFGKYKELEGGEGSKREVKGGMGGMEEGWVEGGRKLGEGVNGMGIYENERDRLRR